MSLKIKLGFIALSHEMQNAECKMQNYDSLPFLHGNEPGEPNGVEVFAGLKARGVSGDSPPLRYKVCVAVTNRAGPKVLDYRRSEGSKCLRRLAAKLKFEPSADQ